MKHRPIVIEMVDDDTAKMLRGKTEAERLAIANRMWVFASRMITRIVAQEHPGWTEPQVRREVAKRLSHGAV